ncbi:MAG: hypothetical protein ACKVP7_17540 [Hyphomicrobiaceae bacterium]
MSATPENLVPAPYLGHAMARMGGALSLADQEMVSTARGSFDRTWWGWKFTDFSAPRFQEGAHALAWLLTSPLAPAAARTSHRLLDQATASIAFWSRLQHSDGSFDEAYPFERSLAATAFTLFYVGTAIERLGDRLDRQTRDTALATAERAAGWLSVNGEHHGVLSNHLAAAAAACQVAGDLLGTDRYQGARDRCLGIIYREQDPDEGWMREYSGADPGYQGHGMFYLADILRRTRDATLAQRLSAAMRFQGWFVHPDGTVGGEYASRGTKFAFPAAFEMLAPSLPEAAAIARHLRGCIARGQGVGLHEMDVWNLFPMLNNYLVAAEAAGPLSEAAALPWQTPGATGRFPRAGLIVANRANHVLAAAPGNGGALKLWAPDGCLRYEDCGYGARKGRGWIVSQGPATWVEPPATSQGADSGPVTATSRGVFVTVPAIRFDPWRFMAFRGFTTTIGRLPALARALKDVLVGVLIRRRTPQTAALERHVAFSANGRLTIDDTLTGLEATATPLVRSVPYHMGSARYAGLEDQFGAAVSCPELDATTPNGGRRIVVIDPAS